MTEEKLEKIYRVLRIFIFAIPLIVIIAGLYLALFPVDIYRSYPDKPKLSDFDITKEDGKNTLSFGVFPAREYRYINLAMNLKDSSSSDCKKSGVSVSLARTYKAFLYPTGDPIANDGQLHDFLFQDNKTPYPSGTLLHLKTTDQVFLLTDGKKILFPSPEIFTAFGYSFDNLVDVDQSVIDQLPDADQKTFSRSMDHPDGTLFEAYPSHSLFLVFQGKKYPIEDKSMVERISPRNYSIVVNDYDPADILKCESENKSGRVSCHFDGSQISKIGRYYYFTVDFPADCSIGKVHPENSTISFYSERSLATVKDSLKTIAASVLNRYFY
ncbi:MAG: hypothetical protein PHF35_02065 [Candidatus Moranbacteria bacterium]|nr:hypothetical protein [Candidatus Moranbacteria bacterium]